MTGYPFSAVDVINLLRLPIRHSNAVGFDVDCPFCGKQGKLHIDNTMGVYRCNYCSDQSGYHQGHLIKLYAMLHNLSTKAAYKNICELLNCGNKAPGYQLYTETAKREQTKPTVCSVTCADLEVRHNTYTELLSLLTLTRENRQNLINRGLSDFQIRDCQFKSTAIGRNKEIASELLKRGCTLEGVPGFYMTDDCKWTINFSSYLAGILIPIMSADKKIQGFQIRLNHKLKNGTKYVWLSSVSYHKGSTAGASVHYIGELPGKTVYVTEGALKATIAHYLFGGRSFVAIAGSSQYGKLISQMDTFKKYQVKAFAEAMDTDKFVNLAVLKASLGISCIVQAYGYPVFNLTWNSTYKGIDDCNFARVIQGLKDIDFGKYDIDKCAKKILGESEYFKSMKSICDFVHKSKLLYDRRSVA